MACYDRHHSQELLFLRAVLNNVFNLPATTIGGKGSSNAGRGIIKVPQLARVQ